MYKAGDLFLKAVIPLWEICSIEVLCGLANIFVQTLPSFCLFYNKVCVCYA